MDTYKFCYSGAVCEHASERRWLGLLIILTYLAMLLRYDMIRAVDNEYEYYMRGYRKTSSEL